MPKTPDASQGAPLTRADLLAALAELQSALLTQTRADLEAAEQRILDKTQEFVRDAQTELLRAFHTYSRDENVKFRKLKADVGNLDTATEQRLTNLAQRVRQIEEKLMLNPPPAA